MLTELVKQKMLKCAERKGKDKKQGDFPADSQKALGI